jgi:hypothetical protein
MKLEIAKLYNTKDMSVEAIAAQLNVSGRSVYRFKNYGYSTEDESQIQPQDTFPENAQGYKIRQWLCKTPGCGFITDKKNVFCPRCRRGPFFSCFVEVGSPEYERFIEEKQKPEEEEPENVEYVPDRIEPRDPSKYKDPEPQDNKDSESQDNEEPGDDNETITKAVEEQQQEFQWICPKCGHEWDGSPDQCPECGELLQE